MALSIEAEHSTELSGGTMKLFVPALALVLLSDLGTAEAKERGFGVGTGLGGVMGVLGFVWYGA